MNLQEKALRLRIYVGELDQFGGVPAYKAVVHHLRKEGIWGATVTKGVYGYGKRSLVHSTSPLRLSTDLPMIIEAVDSEKKIMAILPKVNEIIKDGLITLEEVIVVREMPPDNKAT
jgi:PII-like signaling protein